MIQIIGKKDYYLLNVYHLVKAFFPNDEIKQQVCSEQEAHLYFMQNGNSCFSIMIPESELKKGPTASKQFLLLKIYDALVAFTGKSLAWGILTGVRPTKIVTKALEAGENEAEIVRNLKQGYCISPQRANLALQVAKREQKVLSSVDWKNGFSLYVNIPFCPSICAYCSFGTGEIGRWEHQIDAYITVLEKELRFIREKVDKEASEKALHTIYIGGGTPTTLTYIQLTRVMQAIERTFSMDALLEYTVEAGRPDSITEEKLKVIRAFPVTRISINPQTMQQKTLDLIGRKHSTLAVSEAFDLARKWGFDNINMDLIIGLPGETLQDVADTLQQIKVFAPESLTVHPLAIKRGTQFRQERQVDHQGKCLANLLPHQNKHSDNHLPHQRKYHVNSLSQQSPRFSKAFEDNGCNLSGHHRKFFGTKEHVDGENVSGEYCKLIEDDEVEEMAKVCFEVAREMDLSPYYLYRQKDIAGNLENIGYAKAGREGIYNILMMEEKQTIYATGAGAVTKIVGADGSIKRIENAKNIEIYIERMGGLC